MNFVKLGMEKHDFGKFSKNVIDGKKQENKRKIMQSRILPIPLTSV